MYGESIIYCVFSTLPLWNDNSNIVVVKFRTDLYLRFCRQASYSAISASLETKALGNSWC